VACEWIASQLSALDYSYQQKYLAAKGQEHDADILSSSQGASPPAKESKGLPPPPPPAAPPKPELASSPSEGSLGGEAQVKARLQQLLRTKHTELRTMLLEPSCSPTPVQCFVLRHKSRMGATKFDFFMSLSQTKDMYCFTGKKTSSHQYVITLDQDDAQRRSSKAGENVIGKIKSDRKAMEYTLYDNGFTPPASAGASSRMSASSRKSEGDSSDALRRELMHVHFINSLRNRNPGAMHTALPMVDGEGEAKLIQPEVEGKNTLEDRIKLKDPPSDALFFKNREPKWNAESQMYQLDFRGRATHASCKNIQLTYRDGSEESAQMLMGKVDDNKFNIDFQYPFSALQAFAFALVIFDNSSSSMTL